MGFTNPYLEERKKSEGEIAVEHGNYLLMLFRALRVKMTKADELAVERVGALLTKRFPWISYFTQKEKDQKAK